MVKITSITAGNPVTMRHLNKSVVVETVRRNGPISRSDIADATKLSRTSISNLVNEMLEEGTLWEKGITSAGRGRGKILLEIKEGAGSAIGLEVADQRISGVLVNLKGKVINSHITDCSNECNSAETIRLIGQTIERLISDSATGKRNLKGIGIGIQGLADSERGISFSIPFIPDWKNIPLKVILEERFNIPVFLDCRIFAATLAEIWYGEGRKTKDFLYISIGTGVALGIVSGGKILRGATNSSGQFGHMTVVEHGERCFCGNYGCLETVGSTRALRQRVIEALKSGVESSMIVTDNITFEEIVLAAKADDKLAITLLENTGEYLGIGIADLINLFNPSLIIIGGEIVHAVDFILDSIKKSARARSVSSCFRSTNIRFSAIDQESAPLGAATMVLQRHFVVPEIVVPDVG